MTSKHRKKIILKSEDLPHREHVERVLEHACWSRAAIGIIISNRVVLQIQASFSLSEIYFPSTENMKVTVATFFVVFVLTTLLLFSSSDAMHMGGLMGGGGGNAVSEILVAGIIAKLLSEHHKGGCHS
ncbi:hypothetical protein HNY73_020151 [Argiope bruennichi]|uniref:Uncharacterized protein n=1 Tax=Argiope bruennichi TaxID=94029 RepID=A0A8T0E760_ARGBR|nr:hypothetical protein HNY73_020151 [Argiope bruennichi]